MMSDLIDLRGMTIEEIDALFPDDGKAIDESIELFNDTYMTYLGNLTLNSFCSMYDCPLNHITSLDHVMGAAKKGYTSSFLQAPNLSSTKVLGHYRRGTLHVFPFLPCEPVYYTKPVKDVVYCMCCLYSDEDSYGIDGFVIDNTFSFVDDNIRTFKDVYHFLCKNGDLANYPYLSL